MGWMVNELGLSGNKLIAYALIYGFCQDENSEYTGSLSYFTNAISVSRPTAIKLLKELEQEGLVQKSTTKINNVQFNSYKTLQVVKKFNHPSKETLQGGGKETLPNNTIEDNTIDITNSQSEVNSLFPSLEINKSKKTLFRKSDLKRTEVINQIFKDEIAAGIDLTYYVGAVERWSDINTGKKRDFYGWKATIVNFMSGDKQKSKLRMTQIIQEESEFEREWKQA